MATSCTSSGDSILITGALLRAQLGRTAASRSGCCARLAAHAIKETSEHCGQHPLAGYSYAPAPFQGTRDLPQVAAHVPPSVCYVARELRWQALWWPMGLDLYATPRGEQERLAPQASRPSNQVRAGPLQRPVQASLPCAAGAPVGLCLAGAPASMALPVPICVLSDLTRLHVTSVQACSLVGRSQLSSRWGVRS